MRWLISFLAAGAAVIAQLTIVDRITFPGGTGPDLVLLAVAALALAGGPLAGTLIGFSAGLALDVAPPGSHLVGQDALVFCLIGYLCGLAAENPASEGVPEQGHTALFEIVVTAVGAVLGEALMALLGVMVSDPRVTWSAIKHVLPVAAAYDVVLAPFALYAAAAVLRLAGRRGESRREAFSGHPAGGAIAAATQAALRQAGGGNTPKLRLSEASKGDGWLAGQRGQGSARPTPKREPNLKLGTLRGQSAAARPAPKTTPRREPNLKLGARGAHSAARKPAARREPNLRLGRGGTLGRSALGAAFTSGGGRRGSGPSRGTRNIKGFGSPGGLSGFASQGGTAAGALGSPARVRFSTRSPGGVLGGSLLGGSAFGGSVFGGSLGSSARLRSSRFGRTPMGRSLLGGSVFSRSGSTLGRPAKLSRPASPGRSAFLSRPPRASSWLGRSFWLGRSSSPSPSSFVGRPPSWRRGNLMRSAPAGLPAGHVPRFTRGSALNRLTAALRGPARPKSALSRRSLGHSSLGRSALGKSALGKSALGKSALGKSALTKSALGSPALGRPSKQKLPGRGWLRRATPRRGGLGRGRLGTGGSTPRLRLGSSRSGLASRLHMPRARMRKQRSWRTGGYR